MTGIWSGLSFSVMLLITRAQCLTVAEVFTESGSNGKSWLIDLLLIAVPILEWNTKNETRYSKGPAGPCSLCIQSDASLFTSCWDENSYELLFNFSGSSFPPLVGLLSLYKDGSLFLPFNVLSDTNANGECWMGPSERWNMEMEVPWKDEVAVFDDKLWSILSMVVVTNNPGWSLGV